MNWGSIIFLYKDDRDFFHDEVVTVSDQMDIAIDIVEKDYYETIILNELEKRNNKVFSKDEITISNTYDATNKA